jgi:hypothetical protein
MNHPQRNVALVDVLDQALDAGVVVMGDLTLSVAGVDLVYAGLRLMLTSAETAQRAGIVLPANVLTPPAIPAEANCSPAAAVPVAQSPVPPDEMAGIAPFHQATTGKGSSTKQTAGLIEQAAGDSQHDALPAPEDIERGLAQLVLTIVELLRQTLERQAIRRLESGSLSAAETERLGLTMMRLEERMAELKRIFGLDDTDLNLNLGPLGNLL